MRAASLTTVTASAKVIAACECWGSRRAGGRMDACLHVHLPNTDHLRMRLDSISSRSAAAARHARSITHEPIGTISPDSSATGMNSDGGSASRPNRRHRSGRVQQDLRTGSIDAAHKC